MKVLLPLCALLVAATPVSFSLRDDFEGGIGRGWAVRQEIGGRVSTAEVPGRGTVLRASAGPRGAGVTKAALIARPKRLSAGETLVVSFDMLVPAATPRNSLQLVDIECASCGEGGNPGIRLYLRNARFRVDRSKIGMRHAWTRDDAATLSADRWHHVVWQVRLGDDDTGATRVLLDGREVLAARGATLLPGSDHADRVQIGITANSNRVPATLLIDDVAIAAR